MSPKFAELVERLHPSFEALMNCAAVTDGNIPNYGTAQAGELRGVYLFSEGEKHLYVGRANRLLHRYKNHWMPTKSEREAAFAFKLARKASGFEKASYKKGPESRSELAKNPVFLTAFSNAKARIRNMEYRWTLEPDPTTQCLLEIYVATVLETEFNDFDNH